jgi:hypothetical protein
MTKTEVNRLRAVLTTRIAELERFTRHRDGIAVERSADQLDQIQAAYNARSWFVTSSANLTNFKTPVRPSVVSRKAASGYARSAIKTSIRNGLPRCRGQHFVYGARNA